MFSLLESHDITACLPKPFHAGVKQVSNNIATTQHRTKQHSQNILFSYADNFYVSVFMHH